MLLAGMPDPLTKFDSLQATLSRTARVCSFDRLGGILSLIPASATGIAAEVRGERRA